jgi:aryl-alcohol dehydrogenase-like predicted oxidoreductase
MAGMSLRWLLDFSAVSIVITGASKSEQIERNAVVSYLPPLTPELHAMLSAFYQSAVRQHIRGAI